MAPDTSTLLTQWTWEPSVLLGIIAFTGLYMYLAGPVRRKRGLGPPITRGQATAFVLAQFFLVIALLSPIDYIGDKYLFSAHMVQHLLLASVWPPLLLMALPAWMVRPIFRWPVMGAIAGFLTYPIVSILAFNLDLYAWHIPPLYDLTLQNEWVHIAEHLTFLFFGLVAWWPVLSPIRSQRLAYPFQVLILFVDAMLMMIPGIVFTFAGLAFYSPYTQAPRLWGISAVTDQQIGGLIMWYPGNIPYAVALVVAFYRWFDRPGMTYDREAREPVA